MDRKKLTEEERIERSRACKREWAKNNKANVRAASKRYNEKNREVMNAKRREYQKKMRQVFKEHKNLVEKEQQSNISLLNLKDEANPDQIPSS